VAAAPPTPWKTQRSCRKAAGQQRATQRKKKEEEDTSFHLKKFHPLFFRKRRLIYKEQHTGVCFHPVVQNTY
jgi:hypothetical protein